MLLAIRYVRNRHNRHNGHIWLYTAILGGRRPLQHRHNTVTGGLNVNPQSLDDLLYLAELPADENEPPPFVRLRAYRLGSADFCTARPGRLSQAAPVAASSWGDGPHAIVRWRDAQR